MTESVEASRRLLEALWNLDEKEYVLFVLEKLITKKKVSESLDRLKCTRIVIAHRLSTIKHCDWIIVLDNGHIVEESTFDEILAKGGYFAELVERQRVDA